MIAGLTLLWLVGLAVGVAMGWAHPCQCKAAADPSGLSNAVIPHGMSESEIVPVWPRQIDVCDGGSNTSCMQSHCRSYRNRSMQILGSRRPRQRSAIPSPCGTR